MLWMVGKKILVTEVSCIYLPLYFGYIKIKEKLTFKLDRKRTKSFSSRVNKRPGLEQIGFNIKDTPYFLSCIFFQTNLDLTL